MKWEVILVPLIAIVVAVLASIFRGAEEVKRRNNQRQGGGSQRERARSEGSGIDQFLEEIRRRQAARQESARTGQRETRRPREEQPELPSVEERPAPPPPPKRREVPVRTVAVEPPSVPVVTVTEIPPPLPLPISAPVVVARPTATPATSAVLTQLSGLLQSRSGLRAAFVLREILDQPVSRRRR